MNKFIEKWSNDHKFKTKVKLILYSLFIIIITIYAATISRNSQDIIEDSLLSNEPNLTEEENLIILEDTYQYEIKITIDEIKYHYTFTKDQEKITIIKEHNNSLTTYLYQDNNYYKLQSDKYLLTNKEEVYENINEDYLNLDNINIYLKKAKKNNNQYLVYLKDIILGDSSENYFVIIINKNKISIDYSPLIKNFNSSIKTYQVDFNFLEGLKENNEE